MVWPHTYNVEHDEKCEVCGEKLELRFLGKEEWVFYCSHCLTHDIRPSWEVKEEDRR